MQFESLLGTHILQITIVAGVVWLTTKSITRKHAHLSYVLWLVVLVKCVTPPIWSSPVGVFSWLQTDRTESLSQNEAVPTSLTSDDGNLRSEGLIPQRSDVSTRFSGELDLGRVLPELDSNLGQLDSPLNQSEFAIHTNADRSAIDVQVQRLTSEVVIFGLVFFWLTVALVLISGTLCHALFYVRRLIAAKVESDELPAGLQSMTTELGQKLNLRRPARLLVTSCPVGPAVIGLFRPLIVIPKFIVERSNTDELKPIIAHELIHVRRGDLWVGLFRHFARCLWWFHPLVWKTSNEIRRSAERCCDEEVIASLGISTNEYARALLDVLELKQVLKTVPVVPGVRPFDITSQRLERIMKLGQGSQQRTPRWCWAIALLLAAVSLPGAALTRGEEEVQADKNQTPPEPASVFESHVAAAKHPATAVAVEAKPCPTKVLPSKTKTKTKTKAASETHTASDQDSKRIPSELLQRPPRDRRTLEPGDVLGVYIEGILGRENQLPPVHIPANGIGTPALGFPIPIRSDGTVPLPLIESPKVAGLTLEEAKKLIVKAYTVDQEILKKGQRAIVTLIRKRHVRVVVIREDQRRSEIASQSLQLTFPADEADLFAALTKSGCMPSLDAKELLVFRDRERTTRESSPAPLALAHQIRLERPKGQEWDLDDKAVTLHDGDVVVVASEELKNPQESARKAAENSVNPRKQIIAAERERLRYDKTEGVWRRYRIQKQTDPNDVETLPRDGDHPLRTIENVEAKERVRKTLDECIRTSLTSDHNQQALGVNVRLATSFDGDRIELIRTSSETSLVDAQTNVRNFVYEVTQAYWELCFHFHNLESSRTGFANAHAIWKQAKTIEKNELSTAEASDEAQTRAQYFAFKSRLQQSQRDLLVQENRLRYLLGLAADDSTLIQPIDKPTKARIEFDWDEIKEAALENSSGLRRQRWRIRQQEMQLAAAKKQLLSVLDSDAVYGSLGLGDADSRPDESELKTKDLIHSLCENDYGEWITGLAFQAPLGYRAEVTQLRNQQLQLRREEKRLEDQELEIAHQLSAALRRLRDRYVLAQTQFNALKAARDQVAAAETGYKVAQNVPLDVVLDAQSRQSHSEIDYFRALTEYNLAIAEVHYRKSSLLSTMNCLFTDQQNQASTGGTNNEDFEASRFDNFQFFLGNPSPGNPSPDQ